MDNLSSLLTKTLTDLLGQYESKFLNQSKLIEDLQTQVNQLKEDSDAKKVKSEEQSSRLDEQAKLTLHLTNQIEDLQRQVVTQKKELEFKDGKLSELNDRLNAKSALIEDLEKQFIRFRSIKLEDIGQWINLNKRLADDVMKLIEFRKAYDVKVKHLQLIQRKHQQSLDDLTRKNLVQSPIQPVNNYHELRRLRFVEDSNLNMYQSQRNSFSEGLGEEVDEVLSQLGDDAENLVKIVDELNLLHQSFDKSSINSED